MRSAIYFFACGAMLRNLFWALGFSALLVFSGCLEDGGDDEGASTEPDYFNGIDSGAPVGNIGGQAGPGNEPLPDGSAPSTANGSPITDNDIPEPELQLEPFNGGFFSIEKPAGWEVFTAGACSTFSFLIRDQKMHERQIFYYGEVGPVYLNSEQKGVDLDYMSMGGYQIAWYEMPIVSPLTAENFLKKFHLIADTSIAKNFLPQPPKMEDVEIISSDASPSLLAGDAKTMRALFMQDGRLAEGQFFVTAAELIPYSGMPGGGIGYGFSFTGISAEKQKFKELERQLSKSIGSLYVSESYVSNCIQQQAQQTQSILQAGETLSSISDTIADAWENRSRSGDILSEKRSDAILGNERVYNPDTGEVYGVRNGFYENYSLNRNAYEMDNLQELPADNWDLWTAPTLDGAQIR